MFVIDINVKWLGITFKSIRKLVCKIKRSMIRCVVRKLRDGNNPLIVMMTELENP